MQANGHGDTHVTGRLHTEERQPMSRSAFLRGTVGAMLGAGFVLNTPASAAAAGVRRSGTTTRQATATTKIADLTGPNPGQTAQFRMAATDLGVPVVTPDGRKLFVFGDTYERPEAIHGGWWRSPVALYSTTTDLNGGIAWSGAVGGDAARQLWPYEHTNGLTVLPSDVVTIGNTIYLHAMVNEPFPNVTSTEIWKSDDNGASWQFTGARFPAVDEERFGDLFQCLTWAAGNDGFVYVFSTKFGRQSPLILSRVPIDRITDPAAYVPWGWDGAAWGWGNKATPVLSGKFGELSLRPLGGKWVLTWFNNEAGSYRIEGILMNTPTDNLLQAYRRTLVWGVPWGQEDHATGRVAQPYGGYIIPGSTLDELHLAVSQWDTVHGDNWPYRVMQFRTRGFGS